MKQTTEQKFETVIGLEVHLQLSTATKIFCDCANLFGQPPNSQTCPVCLGLPGTLPVLNGKALNYAIKIALALNCQINTFIKFDRKNYYYPDLPKGYQISQYDLPIASNGYLLIPNAAGETKKVHIKRAHLEEDAGKLIHDNEKNCSLVDYNRTGTPLLEIVTEPDLRSPQEAYEYLNFLKQTLQYLDVSDCDMEKGSLRCDANVSIREVGSDTLGTKTELKNMNSFKAVKTALEYEEHRHREIVSSGERLIQETRLWSEEKGMSIAMRSKEEAHDYRYFPEPDLVPFVVDQKEIEEIRKTLPELPLQKFDRLKKDFNISDYDARIIVQDREFAHFFETCTKLYPETKKICNWMITNLSQELNTRKVPLSSLKFTPQDLAALMQKVDDGTLSNLTAKEALKSALDSGHSIVQTIEEKGLAQISDDSALEKIVDEVIKENDKTVAQIKQGKESAAAFLVGQAMRKSQGKANPKKIGEIIKRRLLHE